MYHYIDISSVVEFQRWWVLKSKTFDQESTNSKGFFLKKICRWIAVWQKVPKSYFQSQFLMSKIKGFFLEKNESMFCQKSKEFFLKKIIGEYQLRRPYFGENIFFYCQFLNHFIIKIMPNFWQANIHRQNFSIFFLRVCWFLAKIFAF